MSTAPRAAATDVKNHFGDYLGGVIHRREPLLIEKHGKTVAVLIEFGEWQKLNGEKETEKTADPWVRSYLQFLERMKKNHPDAKPFSAVELIRSIREEED